MDLMGMKELFDGMGSELLEKAKSIEKVGDMQEIDKPLAKYVDVSEECKALDDDANLMDDLLDETDDQDIEEVDSMERVSGCPIDGHGGHWDGLRGNSTWYPDRDEIPKNPKTNPEGLTWGQILDKYGIDGSFKR